MKKARTLRELFSFPGFMARSELHGQFGDPRVRIITLERRKKRRNAQVVVNVLGPITMLGREMSVTVMRAVTAFTCNFCNAELIVSGVWVNA